MSDPVFIAWTAIQELLQNPKLAKSRWSTHCGCVHTETGQMLKCPAHSRGEELAPGVVT